MFARNDQSGWYMSSSNKSTQSSGTRILSIFLTRSRMKYRSVSILIVQVSPSRRATQKLGIMMPGIWNVEGEPKTISHKSA